MIWYIFGAIIALDVAFVLGLVVASRGNVSVTTYKSVVALLLDTQLLLKESFERETKRERLLRETVALLEQAVDTIDPEPDGFDWKAGVGVE